MEFSKVAQIDRVGSIGVKSVEAIGKRRYLIRTGQDKAGFKDGIVGRVDVGIMVPVADVVTVVGEVVTVGVRFALVRYAIKVAVQTDFVGDVTFVRNAVGVAIA